MSSSTPSSQAESNSQHQTFHLCNNCLSMMSHSSEAQREKKIGNILLKPTCDVNAECYLCCGLLTCNSDNDSKNSFLDAYIERRTGDRNFFEKDIDSKYVTIDEDSLVPPLLLWREKRFNTVIKDANPDYDLHRQTNKERIRERVENGIMERSARLSEAEGSSSSTTSSKLEILLYPNSGIGGEKDIACLKVSLRYRSESMTTSSSGTSASNSGNMKSETNIVLTAAFNQEDSYGGNNNSSRNRGGKKGKGKGKKGKNNKGKGKSKDSNEQAKNEEIPPVVEGEDESPSTTAPPLQEIASNLENKLLTPQEISNFNQFLNRLNTVDDFEKVYPMKKNSNNTGSNDKTKTTISFSPSSVTRLPLFYKGRYCKFSREVSQSPWTIHDKDGPKEGVRKTAWSVEELILQPIVERVFGIVGNIDGNDGPKLKFHAAGREDADVRMLGCGRPFIIEVNDARKRPLEVEDVKEGSLKEDEVLDGEPDTKRQRTDNKAEEKKDQDGLLSYRVGVDQYPKAILQGETKDSIDTASTWTDNDKKKWWATTLDYQTGNTKFDDEMLKKNMLTVHNLQPTTKAFMARLQDSAESHTKDEISTEELEKMNKITGDDGFPKTLDALREVQRRWMKEVSDGINPDSTTVKAIKLSQHTPLRVLHRRANLAREKYIINLEAKQVPVHTIQTIPPDSKPHDQVQIKDLSRNIFQIRLHASSGAYIKEFCHGDFGRTSPSLGDLVGKECEILQLDVEDVVDDE